MSVPLTPELLEKAKAACERATAGPWRAIEVGHHENHSRRGFIQIHALDGYEMVATCDCPCEECRPRAVSDAEFIALARAVLPALLEHHEKLMTACRDAEEFLTDLLPRVTLEGMKLMPDRSPTVKQLRSAIDLDPEQPK